VVSNYHPSCKLQISAEIIFLQYARQARNIQNKPVQNTDKTQLQIRRLKCTAKTWMMKALSLMFPPETTPASQRGLRENATSPLPKGTDISGISPVGRMSAGVYVNLSATENGTYESNMSDLLLRDDVQSYIKNVEQVEWRILF
jgi:hypothetical protein